MTGNISGLDLALALAAKGYSIFPVRIELDAEGNRTDVEFPARSWREMSTMEKTAIEAWWTAQPLATPAIDCGKSGIVVIDADEKSGHHGVSAWRGLAGITTLATRRDHPWAETPSRGRHYFYRADPKSPVGCDNTGKLAAGVDVKGSGGLVFAYHSMPKVADLPVVPSFVATGIGPPAADRPDEMSSTEISFDGFDEPGGQADRPRADDAAVLARVYELAEQLGATPDGSGFGAISSLAYRAGQYVGAEQLSEHQANRIMRGALDGWTWRKFGDDVKMRALVTRQIKAGTRKPRPWTAGEALPTVTPDGGTEAADEALSDDVANALHRLRVMAQARELLAIEAHAESWTAPADFGSLANELTLPDLPVEWRVKGMLGAGHNAILVAGRKVGKTTIVNELVRSLVDDEPFLGRFEVSPADGSIAIFNYEVEQHQYRRWLREVGLTNPERVHVLHLRGRSLPVADPRVRAWITAWLRERQVETWIIDPYSRAYVGSLDNGNDEAQVSRFLDHLDVVKMEAGVGQLVMPVHTPKAHVESGEETAIGSQRLEAWPDAIWYLTREIYPGTERYLRAEGRDVDHPEEQISYDSASRRLALGGWSRATTRRNADAQALIDYVGANPGQGQNEIRTALAWGQGRFAKALSAARSEIRIDIGARRAQVHYLSDQLNSE